MKPQISSTRSPAVRVLTVAAVSSTIALGGLGLSACGGGDETSSTTSSTSSVSLPAGELSASKLASEADALCTETNEQLKNGATPPDFGNDGPQSDEMKAAAPYFQANADGQQQLYDQLTQLQPAANVAKDWRAFLDSYETNVVEQSANLADLAAAGNQDDFFSTALDNQPALQDLAGMSADLGMKVCGASDTAAGSSSS